MQCCMRVGSKFRPLLHRRLVRMSSSTTEGSGGPFGASFIEQLRVGLASSSNGRLEEAAPRIDGIAALPQYLKRDCLLLFAPESRALAHRVAEETPKVQLGEIDWGRFPDGFPNLFIRNADALRNRHVAFLASFSSPASIFEQISVIYALPRLFISSFTLVLPFLPTATMERVDEEGQVATAWTLARIVSATPMARGPTSVVIFDIHALQERFYFGDAVQPLLVSAVPLLKRRLAQLPDAANLAIAYPDEGAWKRFHTMFGEYPQIVCTKVREGIKRIVRLKEGEPAGKHVVIVDDLVQSGGTLLEAQRLLAGAGAARVSAFVTHAVFPRDSWQKFVTPRAGQEPAPAAAAPAAGSSSGPEAAATEGTPAEGFQHFFITDSFPGSAEKLQGVQPFEVISLAGAVAAALQI